jgi:pyridoxamine 5'-phosphate oxidase
MNVQECIQFANENPLCYVATVDGDQPHVRALLMWFADESGFYFGTMTPKRFYEQLVDNPKVEICFYNNATDMMAGRMMRITGTAEILEDEALKTRLVTERAFLEDLAGQPVEPVSKVFRVQSGEAHFWTMNDVLKERDLERISF